LGESCSSAAGAAKAAKVPKAVQQMSRLRSFFNILWVMGDCYDAEVALTILMYDAYSYFFNF
jgi:hypothetical protein